MSDKKKYALRLTAEEVRALQLIVTAAFFGPDSMTEVQAQVCVKADALASVVNRERLGVVR